MKITGRTFMPCQFQYPKIADLPHEPTTGCQFDFQESRLYRQAAGGAEAYCPFHAPEGFRSDQIPRGAKQDWREEEVRVFFSHLSAYVRSRMDRQLPVDLTGAIIPGNLNFHELLGADECDVMVKLVHVKFLGKVDFSNIEFRGRVVIYRTAFNEDANFFRSSFDFPFIAQGARLEKSANLSKTVFKDISRPIALSCNDTLDLTASKFKRDVAFSGLTAGKVLLSRSHFLGNASFVGGMISKELDAEGCKFVGDADFRNVRCNGKVDFRGAEFKRSADFSADQHGEFATFHEVDFRKVQFHRRARFVNREFLTTTDFRGAVFHVAPEFYECKLHGDTNFKGADFRDRGAPGSEVDAAGAYRTLKSEMERLRNRPMEGEFHAMEQRARRRQGELPGPARLVSFLYDVFSDYGQSLERPLFYFFVLIGLSTAGYQAWFNTIARVPWADSFQFTVEQVLRPFRIWSHDYAPPDSLANAVQALGTSIRVAATFQSLVSVTLIGLFLLALRWRFKRD